MIQVTAPRMGKWTGSAAIENFRLPRGPAKGCFSSRAGTGSVELAPQLASNMRLIATAAYGLTVSSYDPQQAPPRFRAASSEAMTCCKILETGGYGTAQAVSSRVYSFAVQ